ncbi:MAG: peptidoglycan DD-metalloendopeptidase family protein [Campylobacteraceae bacterium]|jgi:murein DD-endopeptidase MepM/ murein hydrolase activator NlpD|nr:peptidoglycan DD-metalloendopeptidase family protein [Campylobacteraceae bacterium]
MIRIIFFITFFISLAFGTRAEEHYWEKGETFLIFLEKNSLPSAIYYNSLDMEDKETAAEIYAGTKYYILRGDEGDIRQILIPVGGGDLQLHIYKEKDGAFSASLTPAAYQESEKELVFELQTSPYQDIIAITNSTLLAREFVNSFQGNIDFKRLRQGTELVLLYKEKTRLGSHFSNPLIKAAMVDTKSKKEYVFYYEPKGRYYNNEGKEIEGFFLMTPLKYTRISSPFTLKRWHPILQKYRAHYGIDYAAPIGTQVKAAGDGKVTFAGPQNGYGKTVKIAHEGGYSTLYAHLNGFAKSLKSGKYVKKGELIAYVGNTGVSTGPHLHFGLYKNNQPINPASVIKVAKSALSGKEKTEFNKYAETMKEKIAEVQARGSLPNMDGNFVYVVDITGNADS